MPFPAEIAALVETFSAHEDDYTSSDFKEAQVRQQFMDPLFAALGWDVANTAGYAETYKEVKRSRARLNPARGTRGFALPAIVPAKAQLTWAFAGIFPVYCPTGTRLGWAFSA